MIIPLRFKSREIFCDASISLLLSRSSQLCHNGEVHESPHIMIAVGETAIDKYIFKNSPLIAELQEE
jgi:hypothetical protein